MNQSFTPEELIKLCKKSEYRDFKITKDDLLIELTETCTSISNRTYDFTIVKNSNYFLTPKLVDKLVLRKLNDNIKRIYKDKQANRKIIIKQVKTLLEDDCNIWILRTDVSKFYESINRQYFVEKFKSDSMLSYFSTWLILRLFDNGLLEKESGLPRGMPISATLSEMYMRRFDKWIQSYSQAYFYARFVDDIIIFSHREKTIIEINKNLDNKLKEISLTKNKLKTRLHKTLEATDTFPLEFLGYQFNYTRLTKKRKLHISVAARKVKKIKTRIILSLRDFIKNKDFDLLEKRIRFLTGNYRIKSTLDETNLMAGIYYNYNHVTEHTCFEELNTFLHKAVTSKTNSLGAKLSLVINNSQRRVLLKNCFRTGFEKKIYCQFTTADLLKIKTCWQ